MKRFSFCFVLTGLVLAMGAMAPAATINVPADQPTIQAAVTVAASGDTILVAAGTYDGTVDIDGKTNLTVAGADKATTIIKSSTTLPWNVGGYGTSRQTVIRIVNSSGITISDLTLDCDLIKGNNKFGITGYDSTVTVENCVIKNMSVSDASGGYYELGCYFRAPGFTDAARAAVTVSDCTFIDAGRVGIVTHDYITATITGNTFYKTFDDFGYAIEMGSQSEGIISGNTIYGYDTPAASDGSESAGIYIENAFTGGSPHMDKEVTVSDNEIYDCQYGLWIGNGYDGYAGDVDIAVTLTGNTIHDNVDGGAMIQDEDMAAGSSVTVTGSGNQWLDNGDVGLHIFTQGDGDVSVHLSGDTIRGHVDGVLVEDFGSPSTSAYDVALSYCNITDNSDQGVQNDVSTTTVTAENNWWGDASGASGEGSGSGDSVSTDVDFDPWVGGELPLGDVLYTVTPPVLATGKPEFSEPHGTGDNPFGYDWDSAAPQTAAGAPAGYGNSSFYASVVNSSDGSSPDDEAYRTVRIGLRSLFGYEVALGQVAKITYYTNKPAPASSIDWRLSIYTTWDPADPSGNRSSWYRNRIQNHPQSALNLNAPANQWNLWSTDAGTNQMLFGTNRTGFTAEDISWSELTGGPVTRTGTWDFSGEEVMMIDILLGANSGGGTGESRIDGVRIELTTGQVADIDLSAGTAWQVATVHAHDQFSISEDRTTLHYDKQPRNTNDWFWFQNNGADPDVLATSGKQVPDGYRDGSRTFACTNVAIGQRLSDLKLVFDYKHSLGGYTTINFFMTDGNGKFGIFSPASGGLGAVAQFQVLDADWTRMTIDLTDPSIPDSAAVAVYEHNGFVDVYGDPYTTMTWGDIKNYTIAGMYDYQRSPAYGWGRWGTMFAPINTADVSAVVNGYGLALIWGDTVGNDAYTTNERELRNVTVTFGGVDYAGSFADAQIHDVLELNVSAATLYVKPSESVVIDMDVLKLQQEVKACQAILGYDSGYLSATSVVAGGGDWDDLIYETHAVAGKIDTAVGVHGSSTIGTTADGTVATLTFSPVAEGVTQVVFRDDVNDVESTFLSDMNANAVWPTKFNSLDIVIDGQNPLVDIASVTQGSADMLAGDNAVQGTVDISVTASDVGDAGLDGVPAVTVTPNGGAPEAATFVDESPSGTFNYTWEVTSTTPNGSAVVDASVSDMAGNTGSDSETITVNKNRITGTIELEAIADGAIRDVVFVATGGVRAEWTVAVGPFAGNQATFQLDDVPDGTTDLSAKTAWNLRSKVSVTFDVDGQAAPPVDLTGGDMLLGGDLNGSNSINILDYTIMKINWASTTDDSADINADGVVNATDYTLMKSNWATRGADE